MHDFIADDNARIVPAKDYATMAAKMKEEIRVRWLDIREIAIRLEELYPDADNVNLRFTDLRQWITGLPEFHDDPNACNEKILEAIQMAWIDERD